MINIPHLESNITIACQNRCVACNHFVPLQVGRFKQSMMPPEVLERDLTNLGRICHAEGFALIGGEPTLHPQLLEMAEIAKASGIADKVELWTNGQDWGEWNLAALGWIDHVIVSRYPGKLSEHDVDRIKAACREWDCVLDIKDEGTNPNFTQLLEPAETDHPTTQMKYEACWFKGFSRVIDWGYFYRCCTSPFLPQLLQEREEGADGLEITAATTEGDLRMFLERGEYMESCTICAGRHTPSAKPISWEEIKNPKRWLDVSSGRLVDLP